MRVGIDITSLLVSSAGVGRYLRSAVSQLLKNDPHTRYDFFPVNFDRVRDRDNGLLSEQGSSRVAKWVGALGVWSTASWNRLGHPRLDSFTGRYDVFHTSDLIRIPHGSGGTVSTIYDLAPAILPDLHHPRLRHIHALRNEDIRRNADLIVAISDSTKADVVRLLDVDPDRVAVVYGGVSASFHPRPEDEVAEVRARYGLAKPYLLFVGTLEPRKNLPRLLRAYAKLYGELDEPVELALAGQMGWRWEEVAAEIERLGLASRVHVMGYVPEHELPALLTGARAMVYPSLYEGFGFPPLEAMACGTPVVASNCSSIPEVVDGAGMLVDPWDEGAMRDAIGQIASDEKLRDKLIAAGTERAKAFPWDHAGDGLGKAYRQAAQDR